MTENDLCVDFDKSIGLVIKELVQNFSYTKAVARINTEIKKITANEDMAKTFKCNTTKLSRYIRGETVTPAIVIAALCQFANMTADEFFSRVYEKQGVSWRTQNGGSVNDSLPERFVNAVIDTEEDASHLEQEFRECLEAREIKSKFAYYGNQVTEKYIKLMHSPDYTVYKRSMDVLESRLDEIIGVATKMNKPIRIISLGIGDGSKDEKIIKKLFLKTNSTLDYYVFDISLDMIKAGLNVVKAQIGKKVFDKLNRKVYQMDFMHIREVLTDYASANKLNLYLLLGNTLGNFPEDILLERINSVMRQDDLLLVDNQLKKPGRLSKEQEEDLLKIYDTEHEQAYIHAILERAKIYPSDGIISDPRLSYEHGTRNAFLRDYNCASVIQEFIIKKAKTIELGGKDIFFAQNTIITVLYSKKYTYEAIRNIIGSLFDIEKIYRTQEDDYALVLCTKKK